MCGVRRIDSRTAHPVTTPRPPSSRACRTCRRLGTESSGRAFSSGSSRAFLAPRRIRQVTASNCRRDDSPAPGMAILCLRNGWSGRQETEGATSRPSPTPSMGWLQRAGSRGCRPEYRRVRRVAAPGHRGPTRHGEPARRYRPDSSRDAERGGGPKFRLATPSGCQCLAVGEPPDGGAEVAGHPGQLVHCRAGLAERLGGRIGRRRDTGDVRGSPSPPTPPPAPSGTSRSSSPSAPPPPRRWSSGGRRSGRRSWRSPRSQAMSPF
jgi:hypothetical protein